jgi:transposase
MVLGMGKQDARSLSAEGQEDLRRRVVDAVERGLAQTEAARVFGVARGTISRWMGLVERVGRRGLQARKRGRPPVSRLAPRQAATAVRHILKGCPEQLRLPFALWTREAVQELLWRKFGLQVSVWTGGTLFARLGTDAAEAGAPRLRTKSRGRAEMAGGRISRDSRRGPAV